MNTHRATRRTWGFSLKELLVVIGVVAFMAAMVIPALLAAHHGEKRIHCVMNLKEIGIALQNEGSDNPMQVVLTNSPTMKQVTNGSAYLLWQCLSNRLSSPTNFYCLADQRRKAALSFSQDFSDANISYFFNLDAPATYPQLILAGDRNVSMAARPGLLTLSSNSVVGWTWTELHRRVGNLLMADGSCQQVTSNGLNVAFAEGFRVSTNITSARLVIP